MIIPGFLISILTFPGVMMHELAHQFFCRVRRVPVFEVKYFQFKNPCGYVLHEASESPMTNFVISIGPFIINTVTGALILFPVSVEMHEFGLFASIRMGNLGDGAFLRLLPLMFVYWLGISILMHAFPSTGDAQILVTSILKNKEIPLLTKVIVAPVVGLIYLGAFGSVIWLDLGYALLLAYLMPKLLALFI